ncbi:type VII secretion integral membrane protein EccD [Actinosynnema sp. ALI-1.44]|uniref:type VII secretion integral membrane protein EccD n=1 Tax=Actinosynnema sp. ALI-1.44 TaxID=1933779 RepID=UPI00097C6A69|nr:type VII secretion integral membrane protein EccD [Actinosynnema sp. ALI-1.44]ONI77338.1 type VII secretion integral membrane protein EccD [Actinosynnema sp. ALI-1.44]
MNPELCRVTVFGPSGRADLAVPVSATVSVLLPTLVRHVVRDEERSRDGDQYGSWVLQRLGDKPFDADGTPETLDWLDGEQFYLSRAEDPLPELDFDDVAEGMATAVNRQGNRWNEEVNRRLFLSLAALVFAAIGISMFLYANSMAAAITSGVLALLLCTTAVVVARTLADRVLAAIVGVAGCWYAGVGTLIAHAGVAGAVGLDPVGVLLGGVALAVTSATLLVVQRLFAHELPIVPFGSTTIMGIAAIIGVWLHVGVELTRQQAATIVMCVFFALLLFAPKLATRAARLRGPQLPRTAEELKVDVEPMPAAQVVDQTGHADRYLSVLAIGASAVCAVAFVYQLIEPGWLEYTLAGLFAGLILLRSREFLNIGQRTALAVAGTWGAMLPSLKMLAGMDDLARVLGALGLILAALLLVLAALRPSHRRLLPIWPHMGDVMENLCCIALVPFVLDAMGAFAWARGLAG